MMDKDIVAMMHAARWIPIRPYSSGLVECLRTPLPSPTKETSL